MPNTPSVITKIPPPFFAANEQMQSTNEEMQSVNEELYTVNTDYELKNKELIEINDDLNNYFRSNINGQLYVNKDLLLMKFSPGTVKHINLLDSDIGRPITNISTNIKFETIESDIKEVINNGGIVNRQIEATNGKWYDLMTMPYIHQSDSKTYGAMITFNDITELKKTQLELDKNNKNLMRINGDLDNFVYTASHDLLAPLSNIEMSINVMNEIKVADPKLNKFLLIINSSVKKLKDLLRELATIGKIESEMSEMEAVNINELINDIKLSIQDKIKSTKTVFICDFEVTHIHFSKKNLRSIIYNLISNAIKFKSEQHDPRIIISTRKEKDYVLLSVKDNGIGISNEKVDEAFKMYGRLKQNVEGQGLGLYLAKKLVDAAGGNITVETSPGKGSTFTIFFKDEFPTFGSDTLNQKLVMQPSANV
jgi:two-component system CheB/CheR fusion protein